MAAVNQDFVTYKGDTPKPIFTVLTTSGAVVDISSVTEITWTVLNEAEDTVALITKTKSAGQIALVGGGTTGQFQVTITAADTNSLSGYYIHKASVTDSGGLVTTVTVGRMQVGLTPEWTYNPAQIATVPLYQVRRLLGDTLYSDKQMNDVELQWYVNNYPNVWAAAAAAARGLAAQFARLVDTVQGEIRTLYGQKAKNYMMIAADLTLQSKGRGVSYVYAGGISIADKQSQDSDTDRVPPQFNLMMFDDLLPVTPIGHQVPGSQLPDLSSL